MEIISRKEAQMRGMNKYFTGKPCVNGHINYRYTASSVCYDCLRKNRGDAKLQLGSINYRKDSDSHESKISDIQRKFADTSKSISESKFDLKHWHLSELDSIRTRQNAEMAALDEILNSARIAMLSELESERASRREMAESYAAKVNADAERKVTADRYKESMTKMKMHCPERHMAEMGDFVITFAKLIWDGFEIDDVWDPKTKMAYVHPSHNKIAIQHMEKVNKVILPTKLMHAVEPPDVEPDSSFWR